MPIGSGGDCAIIRSSWVIPRKVLKLPYYRQIWRMATYTLWPDSDSPTTSTVDSPDSPVTLSTVFSVDTAGWITGIRFYKAAGASDPFTGTLEQVGVGSPLGTLTFGTTTSSGWQVASFSSPIAVSSGNTYIASYHNGSGKYYYENWKFNSSAFDVPPLHGLKDADAAALGLSGNGIYHYDSGSTGSYHATAYWVDVVYVDSLATEWSLVASSSLALSGVGLCHDLPDHLVSSASVAISSSARSVADRPARATDLLGISGLSAVKLDRLARSASTVSFASNASLIPSWLLVASSRITLGEVANLRRLSILKAAGNLSFSGLSVGLVPRAYFLDAAARLVLSQISSLIIGAVPPPPWHEVEDYGTVVCPWCWSEWKWYHPLVDDYQQSDHYGPCPTCGRVIDGLPASVRSMYLVSDGTNLSSFPTSYPKSRKLRAGSFMRLFGAGVNS